MNKAVLLAILVFPVLTAATTKESTARAFAKAVATGSDISEFSVQPLAGDGLDELPLLNGCKVDLVESLENGEYGIQWKCPRKSPAKRTAATVRVENGMVVKVLMSTVDGGGF